MREATLEKQVVEWVEENGGLCLKLKLDNQRGFPDRLIVWPDGRVFFVELKKPGGKGVTSQQQTYWLRRLWGMNQKAGVVDDLDRIKRWISYAP